MTSENSETSYSDGLLINLSDQISLQRSKKYVALSKS